MQVLLHPSDQPVFSLAVRAAQCMVEIRLRDVPVFCDVTGSALSLHLPVNEWLFQGANDIQVLVSPLEDGAGFGSQASLEVVLQHKFARDVQRNLVVIGTLNWKPDPPLPPGHEGHADLQEDSAAQEAEEDDDDAPLLALPGQAEELTWRIGSPQKLRNKSVRIPSTLMLPPPWPVCPWARSQMLPDDQRTHFALHGLLRAFHERMQQGGQEDFIKLRRAALESAYYLQSAAEADDALGFTRLLGQKDWILQPLPVKGLKLELASQGRLARLLDEATAESPLVLVNEQEGLAAVVDAWWMFNGEWILVR